MSFSISPRKLADRICRNAGQVAEHRFAASFVCLLEAVGCTVIPIPNALVMVALVTAAPRKWLRFALGATLGSVTGGVALYVVGRLFFQSYGERLVHYYGAADQWAGVVDWFNSGWGVGFVVIACVSTGLFRAAGLGAGFTAMNPALFLVILSVSRGARWTGECVTIKYVGDRVRNWPKRYFKYAAVGAAVLALTVLVFVTLAT